MGKNSKAAPIPVVPELDADPTGWIIDNEFANFVLMNTNEIVSGMQCYEMKCIGHWTTTTFETTLSVWLDLVPAKVFGSMNLGQQLTWEVSVG